MAAPLFPQGNARVLISTPEPIGGGRIVLKNLSDRNGGSLRIHDSGLVDVKGGIGQFAQFVPEFHSDNTVSLRCVRHADKVNADGGRGWHFGVGMNGQPDGRCGTGPSGRWHVARVPEEIRPALPALQSAPVHAPVFMEEWDLSPEQLRRFADEGLLHVPNVVAPHLVDRALVAINRRLGEPGALQRTDVGALTLGPEVQGHPDILNLLYASPAYTLAQRLVGRGMLNKPMGAQTALRFPEGGMPPVQDSGRHWHIDGLEKEKHSSFTLLVGVTLSDCLTDWAGNFTAYPGSHKPIMADLRRIVRSGLLPSTVVKQNKHVFENARQVRARAGDVVMAHHKLAHRGGPNHSAHIRYQIYFRLTHVEHEQRLDACLEDIFAEFDGVRAALHDEAPPAAAAPLREEPARCTPSGSVGQSEPLLQPSAPPTPAPTPASPAAATTSHGVPSHGMPTHAPPAPPVLRGPYATADSGADSGADRIADTTTHAATATDSATRATTASVGVPSRASTATDSPSSSLSAAPPAYDTMEAVPADIPRTPQLATLMGMGFGAEQSNAALIAAGGDVSVAVELLFAEGEGSEPEPQSQ